MNSVLSPSHIERLMCDRQTSCQQCICGDGEECCQQVTYSVAGGLGDSGQTCHNMGDVVQACHNKLTCDRAVSRQAMTCDRAVSCHPSE